MIKVIEKTIQAGRTAILVDETVAVRVLFDIVGNIELGGIIDLSAEKDRVSAARLLNTAGELILPAGEKLYGYLGTGQTHAHTIRMLVISLPV